MTHAIVGTTYRPCGRYIVLRGDISPAACACRDLQHCDAQPSASQPLHWHHCCIETMANCLVRTGRKDTLPRSRASVTHVTRREEENLCKDRLGSIAVRFWGGTAEC